MDLEKKFLSLEVKADTKERTFTAYAATFGDKDSYNDIIEAGAFSETLMKRGIKLLYQHDTTQVVGVITAAREDQKGLIVEGKFSETTLGNDVRQLVIDGAINQMSIGYGVKRAEFNVDEDIRHLKEIELFEVSFVTFPANENARVLSAKANGIKTKTEFEKFLREAGFSKNQAKHITSKGFQSDNARREAEAIELTQSIKSFIKILEV